ncbi:DNA-binding protein [Intestinibacillus sp. NTUH-41-i26]|uniref:DNA-binding protein n=1 Tax=Butyricicoccaceae TaxID=3085642 RepID=UPI000D1F1DE8|nr:MULTISPECIES: DNA-binding protein [Butyricicoccaceae]WOC76333.1 DNA-binding protein [Intestinibacillus sp. NTUH-41-i26]
MRESVYKSYVEVKVPGVSLSSRYELMHQPDFTVLRVGNCMVVPKEKYIQWMEEHTGGVI